MTGKPQYFERIRERSVMRWEQLEGDPELAGPWHQLFKQVQSPRHVLSELLQNADDAGATDASVEIIDGCFVFSHNGEDFSEEHFTSLCRFGYSNKRALHTIGFRGIGFKSTFSLGDTVELYTPTLSVEFDRKRFTAPQWTSKPLGNIRNTQIRVVIHDHHRLREIEKNLDEWLASPLSLLFFKHIRRIRIGNREVHWISQGIGPVANSEWMALKESPDDVFLVAQSEAENFPEEALAEIRQERLLGADQEMDFPPCKVEIVVGATGRLYVVLPTGVETELPYACNAPFIQDPARLKIKDPETSPVNRWLLERVGQLAASVMLHWLNKKKADLKERCKAYDLLPDVDRNDNSLDGSCAAIVELAFNEALDGNPFLITNTGELTGIDGSIIIPDELFDIWPTDQLVKLFDRAGRPPLSRDISEGNVEKLRNWGVVDEVSKLQVLRDLQLNHLPKPKSWRQLLLLWSFLAPDITGYRTQFSAKDLRIVPAQGKEVMYSACEVARLAEKRLLQSESDWEFLSAHLLVLNQNWPRFLSDQRRLADANDDKVLLEAVNAAFAVLEKIGHNDVSDVSDVVKKVSEDFFEQDSVNLAQAVQLAQIAAKLGATITDSFWFVTRDGFLRQANHKILYDHDGTLEAFFDPAWCDEHILHPEYKKKFSSCSAEEWKLWFSSGKSGLLGFAPLRNLTTPIWNRQKLEEEMRRRGMVDPIYYPYVTRDYRIEDWNFEDVHWRYWNALSKNEPEIWNRVVERILCLPDSVWAKARVARVFQKSTSGSSRAISDGSPLRPGWISNFREVPCLRDTKGFLHKPGDLLRRTPETESLIDVEPFIHGRLDTESTRPLLVLLGVRDVPTGPDRLLDCLRALSKAATPPIGEIEKWYRRLDQMIEGCSTDDFTKIKNTFHDEKLILTERVEWSNSTGVYLSSHEDDVPDAALIRASVRDLMLWQKVGVAPQPTADLAIKWLTELESGKVLSLDEGRRVRALLARYAFRIWNECGHWLNLAGEWVPIDALSYALSMQSLISWGHLYESVKQQTADLQRLSAELTESPPFSTLPPLSDHIEDKFHHTIRIDVSPERRPWLSQLGIELQRIVLDDDAEVVRVRELAMELAGTVWQKTPGLEIVPYIDGTPAGLPRRAEVIWAERNLYVEDRPMAKLAKGVSQELGRAFRKQEITDAIKLCFDRTPGFVIEYMEENFKLAPSEQVKADEEDKQSHKNAKESDQIDENGDSSVSTGDVIENEEFDDDDVEQEFTTEEYDPIKEDLIEDEESDVTKDSPDPLSRDKSKKKQHKQNFMERFAVGQGYKKDADDRFFCGDGSWIAKSGMRFPWEHRSIKGDLLHYYLPKDHCLEHEPLQIEADIWGLLEQSPEVYALILADERGEPVVVTGTNLRTMRDDGKITLYPATYRLVFDHE